MKTIIRCVIGLLFLTGIAVLLWLTRANARASEDVSQLEAELGRMTVTDVDQVYLVAIKDSHVPPEVASRIQRVWQYRAYLPAGYHFVEMSGSGRVAEDGVYLQGGFSSGGNAPKPEARQVLMTISLSQDDDRLKVYVSLDGSASTSSWNWIGQDGILSDELVIETLINASGDARSFDKEAILPLLKVYDPRTAKKQTIKGKEITTFKGGLIVLCPKLRQSEFDELRQGIVPEDFDASWIAEGQRDE